MNEITVYRVGGYYSLQEPLLAPSDTLRLALAPQVRLKNSEAGDVVLFHLGEVYSQPLPNALRLGWCWAADRSGPAVARASR